MYVVVKPIAACLPASRAMPLHTWRAGARTSWEAACIATTPSNDDDGTYNHCPLLASVGVSV